MIYPDMPQELYYVYILECKDGSFYTGLTNELIRRFEEYFDSAHPANKYPLYKKKRIKSSFDYVQGLDTHYLCPHVKDRHPRRRTIGKNAAAGGCQLPC